MSEWKKISMKYERNRLIRQWIGFLIILIGLGVISWPFITGYFHGKKQDKAYDEVRTQIEKLLKEVKSEEEVTSEAMSETETEMTTEEESETESEEESESESESESEAETVNFRAPYENVSEGDLNDLRRLCRDYNQYLIDTNQVGMNSLASTEVFDIDTRNFGFTSNVIGTVWVPRLDIKLALYLGCSPEQMLLGFAAFGKSSIPMSEGESLHTAIAGHRGASGTPVLRDVQQIQIGDPIYIETPWEKLTYRVCDLIIVPRNNNEWCKIQPGRNMISLMTCHPYGQNYQRYIVFAELAEAAGIDEDAFPTEEEAAKEAEETKDDAPREIMQEDEKGNRSIVKVDTTSIDPTAEEYRDSSISNLMILADSKLKIVMYVVGGFAAIVFIWLLISTMNYRRRRKEED